MLAKIFKFPNVMLFILFSGLIKELNVLTFTYIHISMSVDNAEINRFVGLYQFEITIH